MKHRVKNIGITLKLMVDNFKDKQIVVTGSSSLDLANEIEEPLTGRKYEFQLFPFSLSELLVQYKPLELKRKLEAFVINGMYPEIVQKPAEANVLLKSLASSYLYKDILQYQELRKPELLEKLLIILALQIGNEVSYNELADSLGVNKMTVLHYINLLEKTFVIFRLRPFSRNLRNELKKMHKIYFYDTGIRNTLINNLNKFELRQDIGQLWENFIISERLKYNINNGYFINSYYWRTHQQQEIDYLEDHDGKLNGFEIKWAKSKKIKTSSLFLKTYPNSKIEIINNTNFSEFLGI